MDKVKEIIKKIGPLYCLLRLFRKIYTLVIVRGFFGSLFCLFPIKKNKVVVDNFNGRGFGDNPGAIVEKLLEDKDGKNLDFVWILNKRYYHSVLPKGIGRVKYGSIRYFYELATAKVWIDNVRKMMCPRKRKKQFYVQTWHGSIMVKKVEKDAKLAKNYVKCAKLDSENADIFITGSEFASKKIRESFWYNGEIAKIGTPRLDSLLIKKDKEWIRTNYMKKLGLDSNIRAALYAPTFRNSDSNYDLDYEAVVNALEKKFGGKWIIFLRFHPNVPNGISHSVESQRFIYNITDYPDLYKLIPLCDVLITDYSSLMFEFSVLDKPVFLYATDYEKYKDGERGFYFDFRNLPYSFSETTSELLGNIKNFDEKMYNKQVDMFMKGFGIVETGKASKIMADKILKVVKEG